MTARLEPGPAEPDAAGVLSQTRTEPDAVWHEVWPLWHAVKRYRDEHADVGFYLRLMARAGRPVVDLGVGYGRVARWTRPDYGVDQSARVLRTCAAEVPGITVVVARLQDYVLSEPAAFSYAAHNVLSLLGGPQEAVAALAAVRSNTERGGLLAFDVAMPDWKRIRADAGRPMIRGQVGSVRLSYHAELLKADTGAEHAAVRVHHQIEHLDTNGRVRTRTHYPPVPVHYFSPRRWHEMLTWTRWRVQRCWGGFDGEPLTSGCRRQVWLVRR